MGETIKVLKVASKPEQVPEAAKYTEQFAANKIGLKLDFFDARDIKTIDEWMAKSKKPAEFALGFDGDNVECFARVGSQKSQTAKVSLSATVKDAAKREKILEALVAAGVATAGQAAEFRWSRSVRRDVTALARTAFATRAVPKLPM